MAHGLLVIPSRADDEGPRSCNVRHLKPSRLFQRTRVTFRGSASAPVRFPAVFAARDDN